MSQISHSYTQIKLFPAITTLAIAISDRLHCMYVFIFPFFTQKREEQTIAADSLEGFDNGRWCVMEVVTDQ